MKRLALTLFLTIGFLFGMNAQNGLEDPVNAPFGHGEDSVKCRMNLSLMQTSVKAKAYKDAVKPWTDVYTQCPAASKNTFIYGPRIFKALFKTEKDAAKKKEYIDKVMEIYDNRLKYFPEDAKGTVLAYKTYAYQEMMGDKAEPAVIYKWLGEAIDDMGAKMTPNDAYGHYMVASLLVYLNDKTKKDQYIKDYFKTTELVDEAIGTCSAANDQANADYLAQVKEGIVQGFVKSGAGNCETLVEYYAPKVDENKSNKEFLNEVIGALYSVSCNESDLYFKASQYLYEIEPTANAAIGLANRSLRNQDYETAMKYYDQAAELEPDKQKASDYLLMLAQLLSKKGSYSKARQVAYESLKYNPNNGENYVLIAQMYASTAGSIFSESEKRGLVFCAAVDKLIKAKSVDSSVAGKASSLIGKYSGYYMDKETAFMMGIKEGSSAFVPGWIGESTTVRTK